MAGDRYKYFRIEAAELLEQLSRGVLDFEKQPTAPEVLGALFRHAHTLKGAARVVRHLDIANAAHALEDELTALKNGAGPLRIDTLLALLDQIRAHLGQLNLPPSASSADVRSAHVVRAEVSQLTEVREGVSESLTELMQLRRQASHLTTLRDLAELIERQALTRRLTAAHQYETLLRSIHATAGELLATVQTFERTLTTTLDRVNRELQQTLNAAEQVQLVRAQTIFDSLERAVRDASGELHKEVAFECQGGDIKLDGHVLDAVHRALLHLVRNAVAHGIEPPHVRASAGKPVTGTVRVSVTRVDQRIRFVCQDDGQGIDVERLTSAVSATQTSPPVLDSNEVLLQALLREGVSTASQLSSVAGRGVGMSAVAEAAKAVGATIHLENTRGRGASFELHVPSNLSSIDGLSVDIDGEVVVLPLQGVVRTQILGSAAFIGDTHLQVDVDGQLLPYAPIRTLLYKDAPTKARLLVLLENAGRRFAVGASRVIGCHTHVVHRLPAELPPLELVTGAVFDPRGRPQLVLDVAGLANALGSFSMTVNPPKEPLKPILVVDDSLTTRMLEQSILESAGYTVQLATSAEEALELAAVGQHSLFLVDVEMPGMDGFGFVETTRKDDRFKHIPAILVSSRSAPEDLARGHEAGASAYIVKDHFDQRELLRHIKLLLGE